MAEQPPAETAPDTPEERPGKREVADPEEYNQTQRLRAINQARQRVEDTIEQSMVRQLTVPEFTENDRQQVIRAAMFSYLTNIEWLMVEAQDIDRLRKQHLGDVVLEVPDELQRVIDDSDRGYPRPIGSPTLEDYTQGIHGIQEYLTAPEVFENEWSISLEYRHEGPDTKRVTKETHMPVHISLNAFRVANSFLKDSGIDVKLHEEQHRAVVDEEVMEEVDAWRKQKIQ